MPDGSHSEECKKQPQDVCTCEGIGTRVCESCYGTLFEACSPELRGKMNAELAQYIAPKRKALEISGNLNFNLGERLVNGRKRAFGE